jgi:predicted aspartyl protease
MAHETYPLSPADGPLLAVRVAVAASEVPARIAKGDVIQPPMQVTALVDTGSDTTCVSARVIHHLALTPFAAATTTTAGGSVPVDLYNIDIDLLTLSYAELASFKTLMVSSIAHPLDRVETLIGRDILERMSLHYDGPGGCFTLSD